ncbi:MAG: stage IV sporulation protein A [Lachnospiraceae bacterium]|nr:stage IV sporulation protein A [Lachnospiraceae bacterium]
MEKFDLYKDIRTRTNGEIYVGIVGPVRTGKSTFARKFVEQLVLPVLEEPALSAARDEMPSSASGRLVTTVEPKFIPRRAVPVPVGDGSTMAVRLVDCVGFLVPGAEGVEEDGKPRMVKTPWSEQPVPFAEAARVGTQKVIKDHATVALVVTTDGSFGELPRESFLEAEKTAIQKLQQIGKPFFVILNSARPFSEEARAAAAQIASAYGVHVEIMNCEQIGTSEIAGIFEQFLLEFPLTRVVFQIPKWVEMLDGDHWLKQSLFASAKEFMQGKRTVRDVASAAVGAGKGVFAENENVKRAALEPPDLMDGSARVTVELLDSLYYDVLCEMTGAEIRSEYQLISLLSEMSARKKEYDLVSEALQSARMSGYGVIAPQKEEISIKEPAVVRQGNRYGVKITAQAPSLHLIRADVITEVSPVVGSEEQANDLIAYINKNANTDEGEWSTLIFGKSIEQLVDDGIRAKLFSVNEECQGKLQTAMKRIVNESKGRFFLIVL